MLSANCELLRAPNKHTVAFFIFRNLQLIPGNFRVYSRKFIFDLWKHCFGLLHLSDPAPYFAEVVWL